MDRGLVGSRQEGNRVTQREKPKGILGAQWCTAVCGWCWALPGLRGVSRCAPERIGRTVTKTVGSGGRTGNTSKLPTNLLTPWMHPPRKYR